MPEDSLLRNLLGSASAKVAAEAPWYGPVIVIQAARTAPTDETHRKAPALLLPRGSRQQLNVTGQLSCPIGFI